jgi:Ca2+-binding EF-hand superfamily protein
MKPHSPPDLLFISSDNTLSRRQAMIDEFDLDGDGEINEAEFFAIMTDDT